jgi:hypothetical protein
MRDQTALGVQKDLSSHPPSPGVPKHAIPQARPQLLGQHSFHASRFTVPGSDARTKLGGFFNTRLLKGLTT